MPAGVSPRRRSTEAALRLLLATREEKVLFMAAPKAQYRISHVPWKQDSQDARLQTIFLRFMSITEAYVDVLQMELLGRELPSPNEALRRILEEIEIAANRSWRTRQDYFNRQHGISLSDRTGWDTLNIAMQVRNSIAHALGRLTARQASSQNLVGQLRPLGVDVADGRMRLSPTSLEILERASRAFVTDLDLVA